MTLVRRTTAVVSFVAVAVWLGGLIALGAIAAPTVFFIVPFPASADAMTVVFRRFDLVAMTCAAVVLAGIAVGAVLRVPFSRADRLRAAFGVFAAAAAAFEGASVSPRIAALHNAGALRGVGSGGLELARLHDVAEWLGKAQVLLLLGVIAAEVVSLSGGQLSAVSGQQEKRRSSSVRSD